MVIMQLPASRVIKTNLVHVVSSALEKPLLYCIVKYFGSKKVWPKGCCKGLAKGLLQRIGEKNFISIS